MSRYSEGQTKADKGAKGGNAAQNTAQLKNCVVVHKSVAIKINWKMQR